MNTFINICIATEQIINSILRWFIQTKLVCRKKLLGNRLILSLFDGEYFIPSIWGFPKLQKFEYDFEIEHLFHED